MSGMIKGSDGTLYIKSVQSGYQFEGKNWDDGAAGRVKHIAISYGGYGDVIHSIQTSYEHEGTAVTSHIHGKMQGNFEMIILNEPLTWVRGRYGSLCLDPEIFSDEETSPWNYTKVISSLTFGTSRETYGPFGTGFGESFSFRASTEICGFHGRSSSGYLNAFGVYIRSPAMRIIGEPLPVSPILENETSSIEENKSLPETSSCSDLAHFGVFLNKNADVESDHST